MILRSEMQADPPFYPERFLKMELNGERRLTHLRQFFGSLSVDTRIVGGQTPSFSRMGCPGVRLGNRSISPFGTFAH
jgi:hypothetical protein